MPDDYANNYTIWNAYADNNEMMHDNSFYWGPRQYAALNSMVLTNLNSTDFISARMRNWLHAEIDDTLSVGQTVNVEQGFSPDNSTAGKAIWYGYEGKPGDAGNAYLERRHQMMVYRYRSVTRWMQGTTRRFFRISPAIRMDFLRRWWNSAGPRARTLD